MYELLRKSASGERGHQTMAGTCFKYPMGLCELNPLTIPRLGTWSTAEVQGLTVPCYALGAITYLVVAHFSDKFQKRGLAIIPFAVISIVGYGILMSNASSGVHYFACFMVACGKQTWKTRETFDLTTV